MSAAAIRGKLIIERANEAGELLVMLPDGSAQVVLDPAGAQKVIDRWMAAQRGAAKKAQAMAIIAIAEWRDGIQPPAQPRTGE